MPTHFTINKDHRTIEVRETDKPIVKHCYVPGHDLGAGWTRHLVQLEEGDTADNPASSKGPIYGPCFLCYDVARSGINVGVYDDAGGFYRDLTKHTLRKLRRAHEVSQGKGDQGAFDVWNAVADMLNEVYDDAMPVSL